MLYQILSELCFQKIQGRKKQNSKSAVSLNGSFDTGLGQNIVYRLLNVT